MRSHLKLQAMLASALLVGGLGGSCGGSPTSIVSVPTSSQEEVSSVVSTQSSPPLDSALIIDDVEQNEGAEGDRTDFVFTVTLERAPGDNGPISVEFRTRDQLAKVSDADYEANSDTLDFPASMADSQTRQIRVTVLGDDEIEENESFFVELFDADGAEILDNFGQGLIRDDDSLQVFIDDTSVVEGDFGITNALFTVSLTQRPLSRITVDFDVQRDGDGRNPATLLGPDADLERVSGSVSFDAGTSATQQISVPIIGDLDLEEDETFQVVLSNPRSESPTVVPTLGGSSAVGTILNDDTAGLSVNDISVPETVDTANFTISLTDPLLTTVTVTASTEDGTAQAGIDYVATTETLFLSPGETEATFSVPIINDGNDNEPNETFFVNLSGASGASIVDGRGTGTILGSAGSVPFLTITDGSVTEGNEGETTNISFPVTLSNSTTATVTVDFATQDGSPSDTPDAPPANAGSDYVETQGQLTFNPGITTQTITVPVIGDTIPEGGSVSPAREEFQVRLSDARNATIGDGIAGGQILDDDLVLLEFVAPPPTQLESDGTAIVIVRPTQPPENGRLVIDVASFSADAQGDPLSISPNQLIFEPGDDSPQQLTIVSNAPVGATVTLVFSRSDITTASNYPPGSVQDRIFEIDIVDGSPNPLSITPGNFGVNPELALLLGEPIDPPTLIGVAPGVAPINGRLVLQVTTSERFTASVVPTRFIDPGVQRSPGGSLLLFFDEGSRAEKTFAIDPLNGPGASVVTIERSDLTTATNFPPTQPLTESQTVSVQVIPGELIAEPDPITFVAGTGIGSQQSLSVSLTRPPYDGDTVFPDGQGIVEVRLTASNNVIFDNGTQEQILTFAEEEVGPQVVNVVRNIAADEAGDAQIVIADSGNTEAVNYPSSALGEVVDIILQSEEPPPLELQAPVSPQNLIVDEFGATDPIVVLSGTGPFTFFLASPTPETLEAVGLTFNETNGSISGTPTDTGEFNVTVQVTDAEEQVASASFQLVITEVAEE